LHVIVRNFPSRCSNYYYYSRWCALLSYVAFLVFCSFHLRF
jgi:hypothetical protein